MLPFLPPFNPVQQTTHTSETDQKYRKELIKDFLNLLENDACDELIIDFKDQFNIKTFLYDRREFNQLLEKLENEELTHLICSLKFYLLVSGASLQEAPLNEWLNVGSAIEILSDDKWPLENTEMKQLFSQLSQEKNSPFENQKWIHVIHDRIKKEFNYHFLLDYLENAFEIENTHDYVKYFDKLDNLKIFRWLLFVSFAEQIIPYHGVGLSTTPGQWPEKIKNDLSCFSIIERIDAEIAKKREEENRIDAKIVKKREEKNDRIKNLVLKVPLVSFSNLHNISNLPDNDFFIDIPKGMPNLMSNRNNSCYFDASITAASYLLKNEFISKLKEFENLEKEFLNVNNENTQFILKARTAFKELFSSLYSKSEGNSIIEKVDPFRKAIQILFPNRFFKPFYFAQEDANDFLMCLLIDFLNLNSCAKDAPNFYVTHKYELLKNLEENAELYDLEAAKSQGKEFQNPILQISLNQTEKKSMLLSDLITKERITEVIDRSIYLKNKDENSILSKCCFLPANHLQQYFVASKKNAPDYFIGCLNRFHRDEKGMSNKRFDCIIPEASLEFCALDQKEEKVVYDLLAVTVHQSNSESDSTLESGHYFSYLRINEENTWSFYIYDGTKKVSKCSDSEMLDIAKRNATTFYYKKREGDFIPPPFLIKSLLPKVEPEEKIYPKKSFDINLEIPSSAKPLSEMNEKNKRTGKRKLDFTDLMEKKQKTADEDLHLFFETENTTQNFQFKDEIYNDLQEAVDWAKKELLESVSVGNVVYASIIESLKPLDLKKDLSNLVESNQPTDDFYQKICTQAAQLLKRSIYLINPQDDEELFIHDGYPIPGENFRMGEEYNDQPIIYIFRTINHFYIHFNVLNQGGSNF